MYEKIRDRYSKNYIRDDQLYRYVSLGCITEEQASSLKVEKSGRGGKYYQLTLTVPAGTGVTFRA